MTELETKLLDVVKSVQSTQEHILKELNDTGKELAAFETSISDLNKSQEALTLVLEQCTSRLGSLQKQMSGLPL